MVAVRRIDKDNFNTLPIAQVFEYMSLFNRVIVFLEAEIKSMFRKEFIRLGKREADVLPKSLPSRAIEKVSRFLSRMNLDPKLTDISEGIFETAFVINAELADKQRVKVPGLNEEKEDAARKIPRRSPKRARGELKKLLDDSINSNRNRERIKAATRANAERLRDFSKTEVERLATITSKALKFGSTTEVYSKRIQEEFGVSRRRALNIARDQTMRIHSQMKEAIARDNGAKRFRWIHSGNPNGRPIHISRNGKIFSYARPPSELPGELPGCQCDQEAVFRKGR